jgi:hypothetical protein
MRNEPHKLVEGCLVAGTAMGARAGYIYIRWASVGLLCGSPCFPAMCGQQQSGKHVQTGEQKQACVTFVSVEGAEHRVAMGAG